MHPPIVILYLQQIKPLNCHGYSNEMFDLEDGSRNLQDFANNKFSDTYPPINQNIHGVQCIMPYSPRSLNTSCPRWSGLNVERLDARCSANHTVSRIDEASSIDSVSQQISSLTNVNFFYLKRLTCRSNQ